MNGKSSHLRIATILSSAALAGLIASHPAEAVEGGFSAYLLGSGGPEAAVPPVQGIFYDNTAYIYDGGASGTKQFVIGGNVVAGLDATLVLEANTVLWVPTTDFLGGTLAVGATALVGYADINVSAIITGPGGNQVGIEREDDLFTLGDPAFLAELGWTTGKLHTALSVMVNIPVGDYQPGRLANISLNRWAVDTSLALSWHDDASGWDASAKVGYTYEGTNPATDYNSGDGLHVEAAIEKTLSKSFSLGVLGYYYDQVSADKGTGARLGAFEGEVSAVGGTAAYTFPIGHAPATVRVRVMREFDVKNRMEGTVGFISFSMPLWVNMPKRTE